MRLHMKPQNNQVFDYKIKFTTKVSPPHMGSSQHANIDHCGSLPHSTSPEKGRKHCR